jgi:hypothetical protein
MKRIFVLTVLILGCLTINAQATCPTGQTCIVAPTATANAVGLTGTNACVSGMTCTFNFYRCVGTNAQCSLTSAVWVLANSTPTTTVAYTDTAVTPGVTYSYFADALANGLTSGPSNVATVTVPLAPSAPSIAATP